MGDTKREYTMSGPQANLFSFLLIIPLGMVEIIPYWLLWGKDRLYEEDLQSLPFKVGILAFLIIISIVLHEWIHGISFSCFTKHGWKSIKFGILWKVLSPYCHCEEALTARQYRISLLMPTVLLGLLPILVAYGTGSFLVLIYGMVMTASGGGDLLIWGIMWKVKSATKVKDHSSKVGFTVEK